MGPHSKKEYGAIMAKRYKKATLSEKTKILNEYCQVTEQHRKHAIRKFNHFTFYTKHKSRFGRPKAPAPFLSNFSLGLSSSGQLLMPEDFSVFAILISTAPALSILR